MSIHYPFRRRRTKGKTRQEKHPQGSIPRPKMSRWQEQPILLRRLHHQRFRDDVVSPCVRVMKLASIISTSPIVIIRSVQIMNPYCKEGGLEAQLAAHSRVIYCYAHYLFLSCLLRSIYPPDSSQPFSGYWSWRSADAALAAFTI